MYFFLILFKKNIFFWYLIKAFRKKKLEHCDRDNFDWFIFIYLPKLYLYNLFCLRFNYQIIIYLAVIYFIELIENYLCN